MVRSGVVKVTRTSSRAGARVAVREAFGSAARARREIERCAEATLSIRSLQAEDSEARTGVGASPINTAAHAAAKVPRIRSSVRPEQRLSSEQLGLECSAPSRSARRGRSPLLRDYSSRMNLRGLSATPFTRTS